MWIKIKSYETGEEPAQGKPEFSEETKEGLKAIMSRYPTKMAATLPALYLVQKEFGYIDDPILEVLAELMDLPAVHLKDTVSFYTLFRKKTTGKYHIQVCQTLSCSLLGARNIVEYLEEKLGIKVGETTPDGKFTLSKVECLGSCGTAPVMQINDTYYENLTRRKIDDILSQLE